MGSKEVTVNRHHAGITLDTFNKKLRPLGWRLLATSWSEDDEPIEFCALAEGDPAKGLGNFWAAQFHPEAACCEQKIDFAPDQASPSHLSEAIRAMWHLASAFIDRARRGTAFRIRDVGKWSALNHVPTFESPNGITNNAKTSLRYVFEAKFNVPWDCSWEKHAADHEDESCNVFEMQSSEDTDLCGHNSLLLPREVEQIA